MNSYVLDTLRRQIRDLRIFRVLFDDTRFITEIARKFSECEKIVIIGTGGSSLGGRCLVNISAAIRGESPRVIFLENVDVLTFTNSVNNLDPNKTGIIVISKSGRTTETLMLFLTLLELWPNFDYNRRAIAITELSEHNDLRLLSESLGMEVIEHDKEIGGRFSVFSVVGLLPALLEGWNIDEFKEGAIEVLRDVIEENISLSRDFLLGEIRKMFDVFSEGKVDQHVLMVYSDILEDYGKWYAQLVGESLGKKEDFGITPILAIGTVDQHSQLQLYLAGPANKMFTIIGVKEASRKSPRISAVVGKLNPAPEIISKLFGHEIHQLMRSHQAATIAALSGRGFVRVIDLDRLKERSVGRLMMTNVLEVLGLAALADVNPFDQPAVEKSKSMAMAELNNSFVY
jgi:glucose-6-phosphate isomerase